MKKEMKVLPDSMGIKSKPAFETKEDYLKFVKDWQMSIKQKQEEYRENGYHNRKDGHGS